MQSTKRKRQKFRGNDDRSYDIPGQLEAKLWQKKQKVVFVEAVLVALVGTFARIDPSDGGDGEQSDLHDLIIRLPQYDPTSGGRCQRRKLP